MVSSARRQDSQTPGVPILRGDNKGRHRRPQQPLSGCAGTPCGVCALEKPSQDLLGLTLHPGVRGVRVRTRQSTVMGKETELREEGTREVTAATVYHVAAKQVPRMPQKTAEFIVCLRVFPF